jgi:hypothetical protein
MLSKKQNCLNFLTRISAICWQRKLTTKVLTLVYSFVKDEDWSSLSSKTWCLVFAAPLLAFGFFCLGQTQSHPTPGSLHLPQRDRYLMCRLRHPCEARGFTVSPWPCKGLQRKNTYMGNMQGPSHVVALNHEGGLHWFWQNHSWWSLNEGFVWSSPLHGFLNKNSKHSQEIGTLSKFQMVFMAFIGKKKRNLHVIARIHNFHLVGANF